jgi:branched-chain amino acid transport system substrate-binding protein
MDKEMTRRDFLKVTGFAGAAVALGGGAVSTVLSACGNDTSSSSSSSGAEGRELKVGFVAPLTGALAAFGEADQFCADQWTAAVKNGVKCGDGKVHPIKILLKDTQSDATRAATVAGDLIVNDGVDMLLSASTAFTVNPAADQAEAMQIPSISTDIPWQEFYYSRGATDAKPFKWTYAYYWGTETIANMMVDMWKDVSTNKSVGAMWPNDAAGLLWADKEDGWTPYFKDAGYTVTDGGRYQDLSDDYTVQVGKFKANDCEVMCGVMLAPDFSNFWKQSLQQGYNPKIATVPEALLFPSAVEALGKTGNGLSTEIWWYPTVPYKSSLTGQTNQEIADAWTKATGEQWTQPLMHYSLFEVAVDTFKRTTDLEDKEAVLSALKATDLQTMAAKVTWSDPQKNPVANVCTTPLGGGQWFQGDNGKYELVVCNNKYWPDLPKAATLKEITY